MRKNLIISINRKLRREIDFQFVLINLLSLATFLIVFVYKTRNYCLNLLKKKSICKLKKMRKKMKK